MAGAWTKVASPEIQQGDLFSDCAVPVLDPKYAAAESVTVPLVKYDLLVVTHSCDLVSADVTMPVSLCQIGTVEEFEKCTPAMKESGRWGLARKGQIEGIHLLPSPVTPENGRACLVVDFRRVYSLPLGYLMSKATVKTERIRLVSPYLEHYSQAFARYFMRVALPSQIPKFK